MSPAKHFAIEQAIAQAIDFHLLIGTERKKERLLFLRRYWTEQAMKLPGFQLHSPVSEPFGSGIALFSLDGVENIDLHNWLFRKRQIHTVAITWENIKGVRVSPNVYTLKEDIKRLPDALKAYSEQNGK